MPSLNNLYVVKEPFSQLSKSLTISSLFNNSK